jgi:hypothetical protein
MPFINDLCGMTFGRLVVQGEAVRAVGGEVAWRCLCSCGTSRVVAAGALRSGHTRSCGCSRRMPGAHGATRAGSKGYSVWVAMKSRCGNAGSAQYAYYGGRGITVSDAWLDFDTFWADMGEPPPGFTLDRTDNNAGYSKENCAWVTRSRQQRNRRTTKLDSDDVAYIKTVMATGAVTQRSVADILRVNQSTISKVVSKKQGADIQGWPLC